MYDKLHHDLRKNDDKGPINHPQRSWESPSGYPVIFFQFPL